MIQDVLSLNSRSGGSTITQQLIKNQVLTNEKTYSRKANEIILAMRLEKYYLKMKLFIHI